MQSVNEEEKTTIHESKWTTVLSTFALETVFGERLLEIILPGGQVRVRVRFGVPNST